MKEKKSQSYLSQKFAIPFGSLILALLLWLFVVSEKEYDLVLDLPIEARNLSAQMAHKEEVPSYASIKIRGTGRNLFKSILLKNLERYNVEIVAEFNNEKIVLIDNRRFRQGEYLNSDILIDRIENDQITFRNGSTTVTRNVGN